MLNQGVERRGGTTTSPATLHKRILLIGMTAFLSVAFAAENTDFSGTWEMDAARSETAHSSPTPGPVTLVIKQTPTDVSVETRRNSQSETLVYKLDGTVGKKPAQDNGPFEWRARWEGSKLVIETHRSVNRTTVTILETLTLGPKAKELTVDRKLTVQHGYTMRGAKNYSSGTDIFVKAQ
jgi:hypothetical protein